jgi:hypothetical protein
MRSAVWALVLLACGNSAPEPVNTTVEPAEPITEPAPAPVEAPEPAPSEDRPPPAIADGPAPTRLIANQTCDHDFVPSRVGAWRRYTWAQTGEDRVAILRLDVASSRVTEDEREVIWIAHLNAQDDGSELGTTEIRARCAPGENAEEPWFGVIEQSLGMNATRDGVRWRWPAELDTGVRFEGDATFDPTGSDAVPEPSMDSQLLRVHRTYEVEQRERVVVEAGTFDAWRVRFQERHAYSDNAESGHGTMWVAQDVGLVRSVQTNSEGIEQRTELLAYDDP